MVVPASLLFVYSFFLSHVLFFLTTAAATAAVCISELCLPAAGRPADTAGWTALCAVFQPAVSNQPTAAVSADDALNSSNLLLQLPAVSY